ncbi:FkbM family methyltransferase [Fibrobacterota bacterium]
MTRNTFYNLLLEEILDKIHEYHPKNIDPVIPFKQRGRFQLIRRFLKKAISIIGKRLWWYNKFVVEKVDFVGVNKLFELLSDQRSKKLLIKILCFRLLGHEKVVLPLNTDGYWQKRKRVKSLIKSDERIPISHAFLTSLSYCELSEIGYDIKLFTETEGVVNTFILRQYEYAKENTLIRVEKGDVVIDGGACWGDTSLHFANEAGKKGFVYCFEFVASNISIIKRNMELNPALKHRMRIIEHPLAEISGQEIYYADDGPSTKIKKNEKSNDDKKAKTLSIDDFVDEYHVPKVDFIKMDIEGSELSALKGAEKTLKTFRPKLAISAYHKLNDFAEIAFFISSLKMRFKIYLDHFTIYEGETILFVEFI